VYELGNAVGRLFEIRIWSPVSTLEAARWGEEHNALVDSMVGPYVCFVDLVDATIFPADVVAAYVGVMKTEPRLLRTGTLLNPNPVFGMQIQRMIREANNPARRAFRDAEELFVYLSEVLGLEERMRLRQLLARRG